VTSAARSGDARSGAPAPDALRLVDRAARLRMSFTGDGAKATLSGLVTNDVLSLTPGHGQRAVALTPKGRVIALVRVLDRGTDLLVDTEATAAEGFVAMIRKFVNPRLAKYRVVTEETGCIGVYGGTEAAAAAVTHALGGDDTLRAALTAAEPTSGALHGEGAQAVLVVRSTDLAPAGFDIIGATDRVAALRTALLAAGVPAASDEEVEVARVEAGMPAFGRDMDAETIPQEANLDTLGTISYEKGCYTGQEVVARIHFRGHVNRHLRWLTSAESLPVGARVLDAEGKEVGDVRSSVRSARRGPLAIAMVRREVAPGSDVRVVGDAAELVARVEMIETTNARPAGAARS
jgi:folate-binding protein YgfZ